MSDPNEQHPTPDEIELYERDEVTWPDDDDALVPCPICGGNGQDDWEPWMPCEHCDGMGYEWWR